jgi:hypothetical protein
MTLTLVIYVLQDVEGFEKDLLPAVSNLFAAQKPTLHLSLHGAVTTFTPEDWKNMAKAVSVFPLAYKHTEGVTFERVNAGDLLQAMKRDGRSNHEMLFTWPGRCRSLVSG